MRRSNHAWVTSLWMHSTLHLRQWHRLRNGRPAFFEIKLNLCLSPVPLLALLQRSLAPASFEERICFSFSICCSACAA